MLPVLHIFKSVLSETHVLQFVMRNCSDTRTNMDQSSLPAHVQCFRIFRVEQITCGLFKYSTVQYGSCLWKALINNHQIAWEGLLNPS